MDMAALYFTGKLLGAKIKWAKLMSGGGIGALSFTFLMMFPVRNLFLRLAVFYIVIPFFAVMAGFKWNGIKINLKRQLVFLIISLFMSGTANFCSYSLFDGYMGKTVFVIIILLCGGITKMIICLKDEYMNFGRNIRRVVIDYKGSKIEGVGLVDTGNSLMDPIFGKPVSICEDSLFNINLRGNVDLKEIQGAHLIPYRTIGNDKGMLLALRVNCLKIYKGTNAVTEIPDAIVGLYNGRLSGSNEYNIILHPLNNEK